MKRGDKLKSTHSTSYSYKIPLYETPFFNYTLAIVSIAALAIGIIALTGVNQLKNTLTSQIAPQTIDAEDFFAKLNSHPELQGLQDERPIGGQLDPASLATLQQQFPEIYADAKVGDFLLRYTTKLIIYDYNTDQIVNAVDLG